MTSDRPDPVAVYAEALDRLARVKRDPAGDEPHQGARRSPRAEADYEAAEARRAVEAHCGPAAARAAEASADHRAIAARLEAARAAEALGARVYELDGLVERERTAAERVQEATALAEAEAAAMAARIRLEVDHEAELAEIGAGLAEAGRRLTAAASAADQVLISLLRAADGYAAAVQDARARLVAAGFDDTGRFNGDPHPTSTGPTLTVAGQPWPAVEPVEVVARSARRVALAAGVRGRLLADVLKPRAGGRAPGLLDDGPLVLVTHDRQEAAR